MKTTRNNEQSNEQDPSVSAIIYYWIRNMIRILIIDFTKSVYVMSRYKIILIGSIYASGMFLLFMKHIRIVTSLQPCFHHVILFEL